jgi:hypothetical protein
VPQNRRHRETANITMVEKAVTFPPPIISHDTQRQQETTAKEMMPSTWLSRQSASQEVFCRDRCHLLGNLAKLVFIPVGTCLAS